MLTHLILRSIRSEIANHVRAVSGDDGFGRGGKPAGRRVLLRAALEQ